jgi:hypothetical protein
VEEFKNVQKLFSSYQKGGAFQNLTDSLHILDEIIESQGPDAQRAYNLKQLIGRHIDAEMENIIAKTNVYEFVKDPSAARLAEFLDESLGAEDANKLVKIFRIKKDFFK